MGCICPRLLLARAQRLQPVPTTENQPRFLVQQNQRQSPTRRGQGQTAQSLRLSCDHAMGLRRQTACSDGPVVGSRPTRPHRSVPFAGWLICRHRKVLGCLENRELIWSPESSTGEPCRSGATFRQTRLCSALSTWRTIRPLATRFGKN